MPDSGKFKDLYLKALTYPCQGPPDRGRYFILRLTQLIVRPDSRLGVLRYKIVPKCFYQAHSVIPG